MDTFGGSGLRGEWRGEFVEVPSGSAAFGEGGMREVVGWILGNRVWLFAEPKGYGLRDELMCEFVVPLSGDTGVVMSSLFVGIEGV
ncbi:MAG: hypothetical protein QGH39_08660 [Candidatus Thermoplasmatota archaeon]|jgi:hypothetical protein|nr:hypothetical protein [Candidatus Thermoplasmatota archaeon]MDP7265614.1 hypothetical protein [Candidatus Thermoplasmatota archaeon]